MTKDEAIDRKDLIDAEDGENRALRSFLAQYSCDRSITVGAMLAHMNRSGWIDTAPPFSLKVRPETHLTKGGAQLWIRHLISLEAAAPVLAAVGVESLVQKLADEYQSGTATVDMHGPKVTLHYRTMDDAEAAFEAITDAIDGRVGVEKPQQGERNAALRAAPAGQHDAGIAALRLIQELSHISMRLAADLAQSVDYSFGGTDYLDRNQVMNRIMDWRAEWDATAKARNELATRFRAEGGNTNQEAPAATPAPTDAGIPISDERRAFEAWMINVAKCIVGSSDPYPAGMERDHWRTWRAAWQARGQQQAGVPDGWKLVPCEPTKAMIERAWIYGNKKDDDAPDPCYAYKAMIAAAPSFPSETL